jgi:hypothetical protein
VTKQPDVDRVKRAARNQSAFRQVNEHLEGFATRVQDSAGKTVFACECADVACFEQIEMTVDEYEAIRSDPNLFVVLPGHVYADVERVVRENGRFVAVAKFGEGAMIAAAADPRA